MDPISSIVVLATNVQTVASAISTILSSIGLIFASIVGGLGTISGICAWIITVAPHPTSDNLYRKVHHIINILGANVGNASNKVTGIIPLNEA